MSYLSYLITIQIYEQFPNIHSSKKDVRVFLKAYNDRGDSLKQGITHILMKEKDVCNELRSIFATWKIISIEINGSNKRISKNDC